MRPYHLIHLCPTVRGWYIKNITCTLCIALNLLKAPSTRISFCLKTGIFSSCLAYYPHVSGENGHLKRMFSKTLSRVEIFGNAGFSFTCGRTKTEVFSCDDLCSERDAIVFNIVLAFSCGQAKMIR